MSNTQMLAAVMALPDVELLGVGKISDPIGSDRFYSARTVVALLAREREACARLCEEVVTYPCGHGGRWEGYGPVKTQRDGLACASAIRARQPHFPALPETLGETPKDPT